MAYPILYKKIKAFMGKWYFWSCLSVIWLIYNLYLYVTWVWMHGILGNYSVDTPPPIDDPDQRLSYYAIFGDATFTTICNFISFFGTFFLIFNPSRKIMQQFAPLGFIAALVTLITYYNHPAFHSVYSIFFENYGTIMRHTLLVIVCYALMFSSPKFLFKSQRFVRTDLWFFIACFTGYLAYVLIISNLISLWVPYDRLYYNCLGIYPQDWTINGQFHILSGIHSLYPLPMILLLILLVGSSILLQIIFNHIKSIPAYKYVPPQYYYFHKNYKNRKWWYW